MDRHNLPRDWDVRQCPVPAPKLPSPEVETMSLVYRKFRFRGRQGLLTWLEDAARRMLRAQRGVILLSLTADAQDVIWVGDRGADLDFLAALDGGGAPAWAADALAAAPLRSLHFVDEWYRRPAPPHRIWVVEAAAAAGLHAQLLQNLQERSRADRHRPDIVGWAIYRAPEPAALCVGFVGSSGPRSEGLTSRLDSVVGVLTWRPLVGVWRVQGSPWPDRSRPPAPVWCRVDPQRRGRTHEGAGAAAPGHHTVEATGSGLSAGSSP
jgi:hypothetical protein